MSKNSPEHVNKTMTSHVADASTIPESPAAQKMLLSNNDLIYITADPFNGNPKALLGSILEIRKVKGGCPTSVNTVGANIEFSAEKIIDIDVDQESILKEPTKRASIMVDKKLSLELSVLNYLSGQFDGESSFSVMVFDQSSALVDRNSVKWNKALKTWKEDNKSVLEDSEVCYVVAVIGFVQKYIVRRKFEKFTGKAKGGAFGVNLGGELYTSKEDFSLDIRYGLQTVIIKRPGQSSMGFTPESASATPADLNTIQLFNQLAATNALSFK